jgi:hypothetical protein
VIGPLCIATGPGSLAAADVASNIPANPTNRFILRSSFDDRLFIEIVTSKQARRYTLGNSIEAPKAVIPSQANLT